MSEQMYAIVSVKNTYKHNEHICFWAPESRGYAIVVTEARIGKYTLDEVNGWHSDGMDCLAVPVEFLYTITSPEPYFSCQGKACRFYDTPGPVIDNTRANWNRLIAAALPHPNKPKPTVFRGKRSSFALPNSATHPASSTAAKGDQA